MGTEEISIADPDAGLEVEAEEAVAEAAAGLERIGVVDACFSVDEERERRVAGFSLDCELLFAVVEVVRVCIFDDILSDLWDLGEFEFLAISFGSMMLSARLPEVDGSLLCGILF